MSTANGGHTVKCNSSTKTNVSYTEVEKTNYTHCVTMWAISQLDRRDQASIIRDARDYALLHGLVLRYEHLKDTNSVSHIPITLLPSPVPQKLYYECLQLQSVVNELMLKIANDTDFIEQSLAAIVEVDDFTKNLLDIHRTVRREGLAQTIISCISRSDYMLAKSEIQTSNNAHKIRIRQVEVNAIASSMSAHCCNARSMHNYLMQKYNLKPPTGSVFLHNTSLSFVAQSLITAFNSYKRQDAFILLVREEVSLNFSDQHLIEVALHSIRPDIRIVRKKFSSIHQVCKLGPNKELLLDGSREIAVVYFRYCFDPSHYNFPEAWPTRLMIERSKAIKCPSINFHLAGAKKFQQVLNNQEQLERFLRAEDAQKLERAFCKIWSVNSDTPEGREGFKTGLDSKKHLVLKPQREGGGHNIYGHDIGPFLKNIEHSQERSNYILMEYIDSPHEYNCLLVPKDTNDETRLSSVDRLVSEIGIYGCVLANGPTAISSGAAGYLVRSKKFGVDEGGVAAGYAGVGSLILVSDDELRNQSQSFYDWSLEKEENAS